MTEDIPANTVGNICQAIGDVIRASVLSGTEMKGQEMPEQARERLVQYAALALRIVLQREPSPEEIGMMFGL